MELTQYSLGTDELVSKGLNETAIEGEIIISVI